MNTTEGPGAGSDIASAGKLVDLTLEGAEANERPDLIRKLTAARHTLIGPTPHGRVAAVRVAAEEALRALASVEIDLRSRRAMLSDPGRVAWLRAELDNAHNRLEDFQARSREWPLVLAEGFAVIHSDLEFHMCTSIRDVLADTQPAIAACDPKNLAPFHSWLSQRLATEADAAYTLVHNGVRRVATQLATQLELPIAHTVPALPVTPPAQLVAGLPSREPSTPSPTSVPARLLTVVMPTYGGLMMALVLPRFAGLELPGWLIAVSAVLGALTMGGAAVVVERQRQLDRRRSETNAAARATIDEYQLAMLQQTRNAARVLQQDLRRATAAAVTRRMTDLRATSDTARTAAQTATRASAELADIIEDLNSVSELQHHARTLLHPTPPQPTRAQVFSAVS